MTGDVFEFFEARNVPLKIEEDGRVFPESNSSQTIIDCFLAETKRLGVQVVTNTLVKDFFFDSDNQCWEVVSASTKFQTKQLLLATGSSQKIWQKLAVLGHKIVPTVPSLFTFNCKDPILSGLPGIASEARVKVMLDTTLLKEYKLQELVEQGPVLVTHWGLSGPAILRLSAWGAKVLNAVDYKFSIKINWLPEYDKASLLALFFQLKKTNLEKR